MKLAVLLALWGGLGASAGVPDLSIHLVRVNDPHGVDGFDVNCGEDLITADPQKTALEPVCEVQYISKSRREPGKQIPQKSVAAWVDRFFNYVHPKDVIKAYGAPALNPPVGDVQLIWKVQMGGKLSQGVFRRPPADPGVEYRTIRAVLVLEDAIWHRRQVLP